MHPNFSNILTLFQECHHYQRYTSNNSKFSKSLCPRLKPTIDDNQIFKLKNNNGHMKVEASLEDDKV